ncbi:hypothetical protein BDBG_17561 [Blastomyces gilchristii SLH14081]|uniref:Uncharacterized protein n=1 Tax=Blastomyces gilchristii (strain SLH14081) TaxID=559298 RepID=A0A179UX97_BLAGS|nr:uncharacterized protein BDBG_17561 [Blastomyces gilchristii SLH14081]OAT11727.1 hypothetical protein BDBG_17561 [Blastomyces gilchristii SLH14081]
MLTEKEDGVAMMMRRTGEGLNTDKLTDRRDDISLQGTATTTTAVREAGEDVAMKVILPRLIDITASAFNLTFLAVTETTAAS